MELNTTQVITEFVDYLMPELKPHETSVYIYLLTKSYLTTGFASVRVGQRSMAPQYGRGKQSSAPARNQLIKQLKSLEAKGCIRIGDTNREGTLYTVFLPETPPDDDYFTILERRNEIYERDNWTCGYCGDKVSPENATLDHITPQSKGGTHAKVNLRTACLMCNSIKAGKTEEEAAPLLLKSIRDRKARQIKP
jgi:hypothetical protein